MEGSQGHKRPTSRSNVAQNERPPGPFPEPGASLLVRRRRLEHGASRPRILVLTALPDDRGMRSDDGFHGHGRRTHDHARPPWGDLGAGGGGPVGHDEVLLRASQVVNGDCVDSLIQPVSTAKVIDGRRRSRTARPEGPPRCSRPVTHRCAFVCHESRQPSAVSYQLSAVSGRKRVKREFNPRALLKGHACSRRARFGDDRTPPKMVTTPGVQPDLLLFREALLAVELRGHERAEGGGVQPPAPVRALV